MRKGDSQRTAEFLKELYAAGDIDATRLDTGLAGVLAATTDAELAEVVRSLAVPVWADQPEAAPRGAAEDPFRHAAAAAGGPLAGGREPRSVPISVASHSTSPRRGSTIASSTCTSIPAGDGSRSSYRAASDPARQAPWRSGFPAGSAAAGFPADPARCHHQLRPGPPPTPQAPDSHAAPGPDQVTGSPNRGYSCSA